MFFEAEVEALEMQQRQELARLHRCTRRVFRVLAPRRLVQQHPWACTTAAGLAGLWTGRLLVGAPAPPRGGKQGPHWLMALVHQFMGKMSGGSADAPAPAKRTSTPAAPVDLPLADRVTQLVTSASRTLEIVNVAGEMLLTRLHRSPAASPVIDSADAGTLPVPAFFSSNVAWNETGSPHA